MPPDEALAAVLNPSLMRALAVKYLGPRSGGNAGATTPASGSAASYSPNAANSASNNTPAACSLLLRRLVCQIALAPGPTGRRVTAID